MPIAKTNGILTYYETAGSGDPLVLLHNDALSLGVWRHLLPYLSRDRRVIAYDRRGHGESQIPSPEAPYTVEVLAEDLRGLLEGLETPSVDLFGCSGGANAALAFTLAHPERVRRLILAEPPIIGLRQDHPIDTADLKSDTIARIMRGQGVEAGLDYWFRAVLSPEQSKTLLRGRYRPLLLSRPAWLIEKIIRSAELFNPTARLATVRQPVLLLLGEKTHPQFSGVINVLERHLPNARRLVLPGVNHAGLLLPSEILRSAVRAFLAGQGPLP